MHVLIHAFKGENLYTYGRERGVSPARVRPPAADFVSAPYGPPPEPAARINVRTRCCREVWYCRMRCRAWRHPCALFLATARRLLRFEPARGVIANEKAVLSDRAFRGIPPAPCGPAHCSDRIPRGFGFQRSTSCLALPARLKLLSAHPCASSSPSLGTKLSVRTRARAIANEKAVLSDGLFVCSPARVRTTDPVVNSHLLCQLSYRGMLRWKRGEIT